MAALRDPQPFDTPQTSDAFVVDLPARTGEVHQVTTMPRSIQEILDHADELAKRFEDFDPDNANEIPVEEYLLQRAVVTRARSEQQLILAEDRRAARHLSAGSPTALRRRPRSLLTTNPIGS